MKRQRHSVSSLFVGALLASAASAQNAARMAPIPGAIKHAGTYQVATGEWVRSQSTFGIGIQDALYRNDLNATYFGLMDEEETYFDEGRLPGLGQPLAPGSTFVGTADRYTITGFDAGYCALDANPTTYTIGFLESYAPCSNPAGLPLTASITMTGLPSNGCWLVSIDLTGTSLAFDLEAEGGDGSWDNNEDLDNFGYLINIDQGQGQDIGQLTTGPILAGDLNNAASIGDGTLFKNTGAGGTGLGTRDFFWLEGPNMWSGCFFFGGCLPCANFNSVFYGEESGDGTAYCAPGNANSVSAGGGSLSAASGYGTANASLLIEDVPAQPGIVFTGPDQVDAPFGCGRRCVGGTGVIRYGPFNAGGSAQNDFTVTIDMSLSANSNTQYWYRDPANLAACGATFNLTNALQ